MRGHLNCHHAHFEYCLELSGIGANIGKAASLMDMGWGWGYHWTEEKSKDCREPGKSQGEGRKKRGEISDMITQLGRMLEDERALRTVFQTQEG